MDDFEHGSERLGTRTALHRVLRPQTHRCVGRRRDPSDGGQGRQARGGLADDSTVLCRLSQRQVLLPSPDAAKAHTCARSGDIEASRKMGVYYMATLLFKTYFKVRRPFADVLLANTSSSRQQRSASTLPVESRRTSCSLWINTRCLNRCVAPPPASTHDLSGAVQILHGLLCVPARGLRNSRDRIDVLSPLDKGPLLPPDRVRALHVSLQN